MQRTRMRIDEMPRRPLFFAWTMFFGFFFLCLIVGGITANVVGGSEVFERPSCVFTKDGVSSLSTNSTLCTNATLKDILSGSTPVVHTIRNLSPWNQEIGFYFQLYRNTTIYPNLLSSQILIRSNLSLEVFFDGQGLQHDTSRFLQPSRITCSTRPTIQERKNKNIPLCKWNESIAQCDPCDKVRLAHAPFLQENTSYIANLTFTGGVELPDSFVALKTWYKYPRKPFSMVELTGRGLFFLLSGAASLRFWDAHRTPWIEWHVEQKWTFLLLVGLAILNNPFVFYCTIITEGDLAPLVDATIINSWLMLYLFAVLVLSHNHYKPSRRLSKQLFYYPKVFLIGLMWSVGFFWQLVNRLQQSDVADAVPEESTGPRKAVDAITAVLVTVYLLWLMYLVVRLVAQWTNEQVQGRIKALWGMAVLMIIVVVAGIYQLVLKWDEDLRIVEWVALFSCYNGFTFLLSYFYRPGRTPVLGGRKPPAQRAATREPVEDEDDVKGILFDDEDV